MEKSPQSWAGSVRGEANWVSVNRLFLSVLLHGGSRPPACSPILPFHRVGRRVYFLPQDGAFWFTFVFLYPPLSFPGSYLLHTYPCVLVLPCHRLAHPWDPRSPLLGHEESWAYRRQDCRSWSGRGQRARCSFQDILGEPRLPVSHPRVVPSHLVPV